MLLLISCIVEDPNRGYVSDCEIWGEICGPLGYRAELLVKDQGRIRRHIDIHFNQPCLKYYITNIFEGEYVQVYLFLDDIEILGEDYMILSCGETDIEINI